MRPDVAWGELWEAVNPLGAIRVATRNAVDGGLHRQDVGQVDGQHKGDDLDQYEGKVGGG